MSRKTFTFFGGIVGLIVFLIVGLLPSIVYGGCAGISLSSAILGEQLDGQILSKVLIALGVIMGSFATASVFIIVGSIFGTGIHYLATMSPIKLDRKK